MSRTNRPRKKSRRISSVENLEARVLLAADVPVPEVAVDAVAEEHWAGDGHDHTAEEHWAGDGHDHTAEEHWAGDGHDHTAEEHWAGDGHDHTAEEHWAGDGHDHTAGSLRFDAFGNAFYFDPAPELGDPDGGGDNGGGTGDGDAREGLDELPILHSNPSATKKVFLDFDGQTITGTSWNDYNSGRPIHAPAYDLDGNILDFNSTEIARIQQIWQRVSEDFAPFNVDVTTEDPGSAFFASGGQGIRTMISTDRDDPRLGGTGNYWFGGAGGVAFLNSWNWNNDTPVWVFENNLGGTAKNVAEAASHEVGHAFGLSHDGISGGTSYYAGHGSGETGWAPIMGVGYNRNLSQWSRGSYSGANNRQSDVSIIRNKLQYRTDDHSDSITNASAATPITVNGTSISGAGIIEQQADVDVFRFDIAAGSDLSLNIDEFDIGPNLDILAELYDASGNLVASDNPTSQLGARISVSVPSGVYLLAIDGVGKGTWSANGYDDYGSLGQYSVSGTVEQTAVDTVPGGPVVIAAPVVNDLTTASSITYVFNQAINQTSFNPAADIPVFTGPLDNDLRSQITGFEFTAVDKLRVDFNSQTVGGSYDITIGPEILDIDGLQMDQDQDGLPGEANDVYEFSFNLTGDSVAGGPAVIGDPTVDDLTSATSITYVFNQPINQSSFDPGQDIADFTGPFDVDLRSQVTGYQFTNPDTLRIDFSAQTIGGEYEITVGPDILDVEGLPMDQDLDGIAGEATDVHTFSFNLVGDGVLGGPVAIGAPVPNDPQNPSSVTIQFNQALDPTSVSPADVGLFLNPSGTGLESEITDVRLAASDTLEIEFTPQTEPGPYLLFIGPQIFDVEGLAMDQNQNGVPGEIVDFYQSVFVVTDASVPGDFSGDGIVNADDIDLLCEEIRAGSNDISFDLTGDGSVDSDDMTEMIEEVVGTLFGDANLDFLVDASDFNVWNVNKFSVGAGWAQANFNCDNVVDASDFNIWNTNKFQTAAVSDDGAQWPLANGHADTDDAGGQITHRDHQRRSGSPQVVQLHGQSQQVHDGHEGRVARGRVDMVRSRVLRQPMSADCVDNVWARLG